MIRLKDVEMEYDNGTWAVSGITLTIEDGEFVFLGALRPGKSTIIKLLTGEVEPCAGRIMINGFSVSNISEKQIPLMRRTLGVIFQDFPADREEDCSATTWPCHAGQGRQPQGDPMHPVLSRWAWGKRRTAIPREPPAVAGSG